VLASLEMLAPSATAPAAEPAPALGPGRLGDFRIVREIGRGGMGVVYEAVQESLGRRVALKVLSFAGALDPRQLQRFLNEARAAACLHHSNIVPVHAVGSDRGTHFYAMQFIDGTNLAELLEQLRRERGEAGTVAASGPLASPAAGGQASRLSPRPPPASAPTAPQAALSTERAGRADEHPRWVARVGAQAALALEHAHQQGIVHRDVKPSNLMLDAQGTLWVTDFGLARTEATVSLTLTGDLVGTLRYMSPEQALGRPVLVDHRTDVYSLGLTLYELLTLTPAFPGTDRQALLRQIIQDEPPSPRRLAPGVPVDLETIVLKATAKDPDQRYASAQELADDLDRFLDDRPILARRPSLAQRARRWGRRHRALAVALAASLAVLVVGALFGTTGFAIKQRQWARDRDAAARQAREAHYHALLNRTAALRLGRAPGYRQQAWDDLKTAATLDVPCRDLEAIQAEAVACLGDPIGLSPVEAPTVPRQSRPTRLSPDGLLVAEGHGNCVQLHSRTERRWKSAVSPLGSVYDLTFTPDGRLLVAGCEEGVAVWAVPELGPWSFLRGGNVHSVAVDPSSRLLATAGRKLELWSLSSNRLIFSLAPPVNGARVEFSADGKLLLAVGADGVVVRGWPVADTPEKLHLGGHIQGVPSVAFSPDGATLASGSKDHLARLWDVRTGALRHTLSGHRAGIEAVAFSPDGALLATGDVVGNLLLWDAGTGALLHRGYFTHAQSRIWRLQFDRAGGLLVAAGEGGLAAWDVRRGKAVRLVSRSLTERTGLIDVALHPSGDAAVGLDRWGNLFVLGLWHNATPRLLGLRARPELRSLHFDAAGERFTFVSPAGKLATCAWGRPEGRRLPLYNSANKLVPFDVGPGQEAQARDTDLSASVLALSASGRWAATPVPGQGVAVRDLEAGRPWLVLPGGASDVWCLAWSADGRRLALGHSDGGVAIWRLEEVRAALAGLGLTVPSTAEPDPPGTGPPKP
jgi:serine/threonine protein kinase/WD40 repeat protein